MMVEIVVNVMVWLGRLLRTLGGVLEAFSKVWRLYWVERRSKVVSGLRRKWWW